MPSNQAHTEDPRPPEPEPAREAPPFDSEARALELIGQGVPEHDAVEQAEYEKRTYNDQQGYSQTA